MNAHILSKACLLILFVLFSAIACAFTCFGLDPGDPSVCSGHGICIEFDICLCEMGWLGADCSIPAAYDCFGIDSQDPNVCSGHGLCVAVDTCQCGQAWTGAECEQCSYMLKADLNDDCVVNLADLAQLASVWLVNCIDDPTHPECVLPD